MKIKLSSVFVDGQDKALKFYTEVLGFIKKTEMPTGEFKWLTIVSPEGPEDIELVLEPNANPAAESFQETIYKQGIPLTAFAAEDIQKEYERLKKLGVVLRWNWAGLSPVPLYPNVVTAPLHPMTRFPSFSWPCLSPMA